MKLKQIRKTRLFFSAVCISHNFDLKILSPRSRVLLDKLIVPQLLKDSPVSYRNRKLIILFTKS
jgi:hypothetical protein